MKNLMVIFERYLNPDGPRLRIGGVVTRDVAHYHGVPHGSVQVAIVVLKRAQGKTSPHILLHHRSKWKKTCPETWDVCGGHIDAGERILNNPNVWDDQMLIKALFAETALREANEEFRALSNPDFRFTERHLRCFGGLAVFETGFDDPSAANKEHSAFYAAFVPGDIATLEDSDDVKSAFQVVDSVGVGGAEKEAVALDLKLVSLPDLVLDFTRAPGDYGDGIARVLSRAAREPGTMKAVVKFLGSYYAETTAGR
ncbi:MAG TPA: NUDIX domain-containing protein [Anaerolineae bacterium]|nr:NUDIX domain-containing protein [Anaerolineae bacterium]